MMNLADIKHINFIGIGGIGMSALARYFHSLGIQVSGYDKTPSALTKELEAEGMTVHYEDDWSKAPKDVQAVVFTPAIPATHSELSWYKENGYPVLKRSDVLQIISEHAFNICVAGTHGKTTISTMTAHILRDTGYGCNAFLGGIASNYDTNFWSHSRNCCVIEADEYDRSFLKLSPDVAVISAMDPDHLDIYGTAEEMEEAYIQFVGKIRSGGVLISKKGLKRENNLIANNPITGLTYHREDASADVYAKNLRIEKGAYVYDLVYRGMELKELVLNVGGLHNVENSVAAMAVALWLQINPEKIRKAVASFRGVKRRFEYIVKDEEVVMIDDYAHHPEELRWLIMSVKDLYPDRECVVVFQPHLFTRTRDLADGFAEVLDLADEVMLLPIYPARELPLEGVSSEMIRERMKKAKVSVLDKEGVVSRVKGLGFRDKVLVTAGAGDIDRMLVKLKDAIS
ncbi:MAG: UDP-N-acetylmuramate--L-alanine ligase [Sphingobacteriales bacterium]|nr:MAG: UDP-N-acetylmuramate--L-alanine ligase [Sphingobacteriales bacterium]